MYLDTGIDGKVCEEGEGKGYMRRKHRVRSPPRACVGRERSETCERNTVKFLYKYLIN